MSSLSNVRKLIADLNEDEENWQKEVEKHFADQNNKYRDLFERLKHIKDNSEKCMDNITKGLDYLVSNQYTIEKALKQTENLDGLPIAPEQQENAVDLVNKMTKFMNNTELVTSPNSFSPQEIHKDIASYTADVAEDLKVFKTQYREVEALYDKIQLLHDLISNSGAKTESQDMDKSQHKKLYTITEDE